MVDTAQNASRIPEPPYRDGSRLFQASSASRAFSAAVASVEGCNAGRLTAILPGGF